MEPLAVSSEGQIVIPKPVRDALNLAEGTRLNLEVQGQTIVLSKEPAWKKLRGAARGCPDLMERFAEFRKRERELEDSHI